ncbi:MAG TPA: TIGR03086 family metal-binding protein [Acidimicrobiales bacterium]|nr:TIGR03086 family metal-binding protein [Acidimicrobiales bacterium]
MDAFEALDRARGEFDKRLRAVRNDQWDDPTPCEGWTVRDLAQHVVGANRMAVKLLAGEPVERALPELVGDVLGDDPVAAFVQSAEAQEAAFRAPGALAATCHHPVGDIPGEMLLGFRLTDLTLHAWDLARAVGADETLDPELVQLLWERLEPMGPVLGTMGMFGSGPSGELPEDAPVQHKLLDVSGRRP